MSPRFIRKVCVVVNLKMRDAYLTCALALVFTAATVSAAEVGQGAVSAQSAGPTGAPGSASELVKRLQRKPIAGKPARELFGSATWQPPVKPVPAAAAAPAPAPVAPLVPYVFMGRMTQQGGFDIIFLTKGTSDQVYTITAAGNVLDGVYRVDEVAADHIALTYLPLNTKQILSFAAGAAPPAERVAPSQPREMTVPIATRDVISSVR